MDLERIYGLLASQIAPENIKLNEPMTKHTTFRIGGVADLFVSPSSVAEILSILDICKKEQIPYYVVGNGSNLLVSDKGIRGVVIEIGKNLANVTVTGNVVTAEAGALLAKIAQVALSHQLTGLECGHGIPGTLGGAVVMNAGAYGWELKDVLVDATVLTPEGEVKQLPKEALSLGYRTSIVPKAGYIVLAATLHLAPGETEKISGRMKELIGQRKEKQPLEFPSAGSTFKRPPGHFAGKLIMDSGLRGFQVGGAKVSDKHCGFVINAGGATCEDVLQLIKEVQKVVADQYEVALETEVKYVGEA